MPMQPDDPALDQVRAIFREEGRDFIQRLEDGLLRLEQAPAAQREEIVRAMLREAHSLKGAAGSLGLKATSELAHAVESALKQEGLSAERFDALHKAVDVLKVSLDDRRMPQGGAEVLAALRAKPPEAAPPASVPASGAPADAKPAAAAPAQAPEHEGGGAAPALPERDREESVRIPQERLQRLMMQAGEVSLRLNSIRQRTADLRAIDSQLGSSLVRVAEAAGYDTQAVTEIEGIRRALVAMVARFEFDVLHDALLGDALHAEIRSLRLRPLSMVFRPLPRMGRDVARELGKEVLVTLAGSTIEVERTVLDTVRDSLVHLLRNAVDHGIESPAERAAAGKAPVGRIHVSARLQGSTLCVEVTDDGRGVNAARVRDAAVARNVISEAEAEFLTADAAMNLVFQPGVSTKDKPTEISGRGVGLDAVRAAVERQRGSIRVTSELGKGATFVLQIPIVSHRGHVLVARVGNERLAIPSTSVWKVNKIPEVLAHVVPGQTTVEIEGVNVPVVPLGPLLFAGDKSSVDAKGYLVALKAQGRAVAVGVDELLLDEEVVVRELDPPLETPPLLSGVAVRPNGDVMCILSPPDLVRAAGVRAPIAEPAQIPLAPTRARRVLVVDDSFTVRTLEKTILEMAGYEVLTAGDGEEALATLTRETLDAVVSDINMPRRDGFELLAAVRQNQRLREIPFILVTSRGSEVDRRRGLELGASAYVAKSEFDQEQLLEVVGRLAG